MNQHTEHLPDITREALIYVQPRVDHRTHRIPLIEETFRRMHPLMAVGMGAHVLGQAFLEGKLYPEITFEKFAETTKLNPGIATAQLNHLSDDRQLYSPIRVVNDGKPKTYTPTDEAWYSKFFQASALVINWMAGEKLAEGSDTTKSMYKLFTHLGVKEPESRRDWINLKISYLLKYYMDQKNPQIPEGVKLVAPYFEQLATTYDPYLYSSGTQKIYTIDDNLKETKLIAKTGRKSEITHRGRSFVEKVIAPLYLVATKSQVHEAHRRILSPRQEETLETGYYVQTALSTLGHDLLTMRRQEQILS